MYFIFLKETTQKKEDFFSKTPILSAKKVNRRYEREKEIALRSLPPFLNLSGGITMSETTVNNQHKDRLFKFIFGRHENREWTLSLYNAVNKSSYTDSDAIQITTIEDVLYLSMKNDLSFLLADTMSFYEQQSSFNPNMPMRMLIYAGMVYSKYVESHKADISLHSYSQQHFPTPRMICFYNGEARQPDSKVLELKSAFKEGSEPDIDVSVTMLNINRGRNAELMSACRPLADYSQFVADVRNYGQQLHDMDSAIRKAVDALPEDSMIREYLLANIAEVKEMCLTEYDEDAERKFLKNEGRKEGIAEGLEKGLKKGLSEGRKEGRKEGLSEGRRMEAERMGTLISRLIKDKRISDADRASTDAAYRDALYKEFNL